MDAKERKEALADAEQRIARILSALESATGAYVESLSINDLEVTTYEDDRPRYRRSVRIELKRLPGTEWST